MRGLRVLGLEFWDFRVEGFRVEDLGCTGEVARSGVKHPCLMQLASTRSLRFSVYLEFPNITTTVSSVGLAV